MIYDGEDSNFIEELRSYGVNVIFHKLSFDAALKRHGAADKDYYAVARGAFLRFDIPIVDHSDDNYVLYTDADVMFFEDPDFSTFLPTYFAAAPQFARGQKTDMNSGVMLINQTNFKLIHGDLIKFTQQNLRYGLDQEILRKFFGKNYMMLPDKYNWKPYWGKRDDLAILHWHGPKPETVRQLAGNPGLQMPSSWRGIWERNTEAYSSFVDAFYEFLSGGDLDRAYETIPDRSFSRAKFFREHFAKSDSILEIGASYNPLFPKADGWNTTVVDHTDKESLRSTYKSLGDLVENIEDVDVIWHGGSLPDILNMREVSGYDGVILSHVLEHMPNPLEFFFSCRTIIKDCGRIIIAFPDKRFCFDYFQNVTNAADWLISYKDEKMVHDAVTAYEHVAYAVKNAGQIAWKPSSPESLGFVHTLDEAWGSFQRNFENARHHRRYVDFHAWRFVPSAFRLIVAELSHVGMLDFHVNNVYQPEDSNEFFIELLPGTLPNIFGMDIERTRLFYMKNIAREMEMGLSVFRQNIDSKKCGTRIGGECRETERLSENVSLFHKVAFSDTVNICLLSQQADGHIVDDSQKGIAPFKDTVLGDRIKIEFSGINALKQVKIVGDSSTNSCVMDSILLEFRLRGETALRFFATRRERGNVDGKTIEFLYRTALPILADTLDIVAEDGGMFSCEHVEMIRDADLRSFSF